jgi:hypothetical protein
MKVAFYAYDMPLVDCRVSHRIDTALKSISRGVKYVAIIRVELIIQYRPG